MPKNFPRAVGLAGLVCGILSSPASAQTGPTQGWTGWARCQIDVQGPGYTHQEIHTWTLAGGVPTVEGAFRVYPGAWSVVGGGSLQKSQGSQSLMAQWATNAQGVSAPIAVSVRNGRMFIQAWHAQLRSQGGVAGYQQIIDDTGAKPPGQLSAEAFEWAFPVVNGATTATTMSGSNAPGVNGPVGLMQPAGSFSTASCTWEFGKGSNAPAAPAPLQARAVPTPGSVGPPGAPRTGTQGTNNAPPTNATPPTNAGTSGTGSGLSLPTTGRGGLSRLNTPPTNGATNGGSGTTSGGAAGARAADVRVTLGNIQGLAADAQTIRRGTTVTWGFRFTNLGPDALEGALLRVPATPGLTMSGASFCTEDRPLECLGFSSGPLVLDPARAPVVQAGVGPLTLPPLTSYWVLVQAVAATPGAAVLTAEVIMPSGTNDPYTQDNRVTLSYTISAAP
jgi:hypothetical protein